MLCNVHTENIAFLLKKQIDITGKTVYATDSDIEKNLLLRFMPSSLIHLYPSSSSGS